MTQELEHVGSAPITRAARSAFQQEQVAVIKDTVAKDCSPAELHMFLEIAARHGLDPFLGQIYAAKMGGQDGGRGRVVIMVPRDGFLAKAQEKDDFEGMDGDVVREKDTFRVVRGKDGREVEHSYGGTGEEKDRGKIVGAWAIVYRTKRKPTYFYAPIEEYKPGGRKLQVSPWGKQESAMILKCAESTCLRKAFSITGVAGAEEMQKQLLESAAAPDPTEIDWGEGVQSEMLKAYFDAINEVKPGTYKPAKIRVMLRGTDETDRRQILDDLREEIEDAGGTVPEPPIEAEAVDMDEERAEPEPEPAS